MSKFHLAFATPRMVKEVVQELVLPLFHSIPDKSRDDGHIIIVGPLMIKAEGKPFPVKYSLEPTIIYEYSIGNKSNWEFPFDEIAQCKALQMYHGRNIPGNMNSQAHMLFEGDTPFFGAHREGFLVAGFSGIQSYYDQMISKVALAAIVARAEHKKQIWLAKHNGECFVQSDE